MCNNFCSGVNLTYFHEIGNYNFAAFRYILHNMPLHVILHIILHITLRGTLQVILHVTLQVI